MTPYEIEILIHYYVTPVEFPRFAAPLFRPTMKAFIRDGLVEETSSGPASYVLTEKGKFYVQEGLCNVPLPRYKWEIPPMGGTGGHE